MTDSNQLEKDFQILFDSIHGYSRPEHRAVWTTNLWQESTEYKQAYDNFWVARKHLCERFGIDWEDDDLELFMNGINDMAEDLCRWMFLATVEYAKRGFRIETMSDHPNP
ncbi:MAG: hypothetical protein IJD98_00085 [Oscillospiraceae bacterium]|nr:hypothetical protein [Oscillospiraceae bacterium]